MVNDVGPLEDDTPQYPSVEDMMHELMRNVRRNLVTKKLSTEERRLLTILYGKAAKSVGADPTLPAMG